MEPAKILIVDDEPAMLENCRRLLSRDGHRCRTLADPSRVRDVLSEMQPDVMLLDLRMPGVDGMTVLTVALAEDSGLPVIMMTAYGSVASAVRAIGEGAFDYLTKPFSRDELRVAVQRAAAHRGLVLENRNLRARIVDGAGHRVIVGSSPTMRRLLDHVAKVAATDANVLITGESGTGKELVARSIHAQSARRERPFMPIDCAALPENLLESELFGYERGAFTGAVSRRRGLLDEADGGTVFLDEITELSMGLQSKLLRVLEERQLRRLGGSALIDVDIRVVAATNIDLPAAIAAGTFREDLYYRLNVVPIHIAPLRERDRDVVLLAQKFFAQFSADQGKDAPRISAEVWDALQEMEWPGNVRELRNVAERLIVLDDDGRITLGDLQEVLRSASPAGVEETSEPLPPSYEEARAQALQTFRAKYVRRLLAANEGNVAKAARVAGINRRTLHRWIAELGEDVG
jgi:DNA-binding NtrC family response regulator